MVIYVCTRTGGGRKQSSYLNPINPPGWLMKFKACDGRNGAPSFSHLISGDGKALICASKFSGWPMVTLRSFNGLMNSGFNGSAAIEWNQIKMIFDNSVCFIFTSNGHRTKSDIFAIRIGYDEFVCAAIGWLCVFNFKFDSSVRCVRQFNAATGKVFG